MAQQVKVITYEMSKGKYFYRKLFVLEPMEEHMGKMLSDGWIVQSQNTVGGQTNISATAAKAIITGGLSLLFGDTNKTEKIIITYTRNINDEYLPVNDEVSEKLATNDEAEAMLENLKLETRKAMEAFNDLSEDVLASINDLDLDRQIKEMHDNGQLDMTITSHDNKYNKVKIVERYSSGEIKFEGFQVDVDLNGSTLLKTGQCVHYWLNGQKMFEGEYISGLKNGQFVYWSENGIVSRKGEYCNGVQIGKWTFYDENGNIRMEGKYKRGNQDGLWKETNESGKVVEIKYKNGIPS